MPKPTKTAGAATHRPADRTDGAPALPLERRSRRVHSPAPHLYRNRHGTYYFRIRFGGSEVKRSLGTKDRNMATMLAAQINFRLAMQPKDESELIAEIVRKAQAGDLRQFDVQLNNGMTLTNIKTAEDVDGALSFVRGLRNEGTLGRRVEDIGLIEPEVQLEMARRAAERATTQPAPSAPILATAKFLDAVEPYLTEKEHETENEGKTIKEKRATYKRFTDLVGNLEIGQITKDHAARFKAQLMGEGLGTTRINKLLSYIRNFLTYAVGNIPGIEDNVFAKVRMSSKKKIKQKTKTTKFLGFTRAELDQIFDPTAYKTYCRRQPHYFWMPLLCLLTGARPDEIASLPLSGVQNIDGVDFLDIDKAKNGPSIRKVPIHAALIEGGFLDYVQKLRKAGEQRLFPGLKDGDNGFIKNVSRRFNQEHLDKIGLTNPRKRLYSFRTTFISKLATKKWHPVLIMAVVGHYEQEGLDLSLPHFNNYQDDKAMADLQKWSTPSTCWCRSRI